jgi:hypothetical protein
MLRSHPTHRRCDLVHSTARSAPEKEQSLGVWRDADGIRWKHLGNENMGAPIKEQGKGAL